MVQFLERLLNLRRGDLGRGTLLFSYLFFIIAGYVVGKVARNALFLGQFAAVKLPYFIIISAVLVGFVVAGYVRIGRQTGLRNLLVGSLLFFATNAVLFWWLAHFFRLPWLYPVIYIWVGIFGVLAPAQVWTLANYVLTTREAKRLFGLVGSGAISGWIFGGFFAKAATQRFGTESLLLGMAVFLAICSVLVVFIWRQRRTPLEEAEEREEATGEDGLQTFQSSLRRVWTSPYLRAIAAVICLSSFVTTMAGWQLDAIAQRALVTQTKLALFYADFNFYAAVVSLLIQLMLTSRVLRRFGIGPALFTVPIALFFGSVGVLVWGTLTAAVILKGSDQILRYSIDKSSVELLYLPVAVSVKLHVKSFIDTVIWRMGDGLAALTLVVFADKLGWLPGQVSWVVLALILGWIAAAFVARRQYVVRLRECIRQHRLDAERAMVPVLDRSTTEILATNVRAGDPQQILYALSLFEVSHRAASHPAVRDLLDHPAPEVRQKAISLLAAAGDRTVLPRVQNLLRDPHVEVRTEALLYLTHHTPVDPMACIQQLGDFADFSMRSAMVAFLAQPGERQNIDAAQLILEGMVRESGSEGERTRLEAARLLSVLPDQFDQQLRALLDDPNPEVARHAIRTVGHLRKRRFIPRVLDRLADQQLVPDVSESVAKFGNRIVGTIRDHLSDPTVPLEVRREIPSVLARIGTAAADQVLLEHLLESDTTLRFRTISALNKIHQRHPEVELDRQMIETVLAAEILGHYRSYQILGTLGGSLGSEEPVVQALRESIKQEVERIFRLLGLLFPHYDFHSAYFGLQSNNVVVHDNALEFLDTVLKPQLRNLLVPLFDSEVNVAERVRLANRIVGAKLESRDEAVATLVGSEDPWLRSCGAYAIGKFGLKSLERELDRCLDDPDPLLRETARQAKLRLAALSEAAGPVVGGASA